MFLDHLINKFKRDKKIEIKAEVSVEKVPIKKADIEVTHLENFIKVEIKNNCTIGEYCEAVREKKEVYKQIGNVTLWDGSLRGVRKNIIYIFSIDNRLYNVYNNLDKIHIDERIYHKDEEEWTDEILIEIEKQTNKYHISRLKHDKIHSTFYTKFYPVENLGGYFFLEDAHEIAHKTLERLKLILNIETILDLQYVSDCIDEKFKEKTNEEQENVIVKKKI